MRGTHQQRRTRESRSGRDPSCDPGFQHFADRQTLALAGLGSADRGPRPGTLHRFINDEPAVRVVSDIERARLAWAESEECERKKDAALAFGDCLEDRVLVLDGQNARLILVHFRPRKLWQLMELAALLEPAEEAPERAQCIAATLGERLRSASSREKSSSTPYVISLTAYFSKNEK